MQIGCVQVFGQNYDFEGAVETETAKKRKVLMFMAQSPRCLTRVNG